MSWFRKLGITPREYVVRRAAHERAAKAWAMDAMECFEDCPAAKYGPLEYHDDNTDDYDVRERTALAIEELLIKPSPTDFPLAPHLLTWNDAIRAAALVARTDPE